MRFLFIVGCCLCAFLTSCTGPQGPVGPQGPAGDPASSAKVVYIGGDMQVINVSSTPALSRTLSIQVDGPGTIIFEASGYFYYHGSANPYSGRASWSTNSTTMMVDYICSVYGNNTILYNPYYVSRKMSVTAAGTYTSYLLGDLPVGSGIQMCINSVVATFYPD
jgi:hypothetical protein